MNKLVKRKLLQQFFLYWLFLLVSVVLVQASIALDPLLENYHLGETVNVVATVSELDDMKGTVRVMLSCSNYEVNYYTDVFSIKSGEVKQTLVPELQLLGLMSGTCSVNMLVESFDKQFSQTGVSTSFVVNDQIGLSVSFEDKIYSPGDQIKLKGTLDVTYDGFKEADVTAILGDSFTKRIKGTEFILAFTLPDSIHAFGNDLTVSVVDQYGNNGEFKGVVQVDQIPSELLIDLDKDAYDPGDKVRILSKYVDQAGEVIKEEIVLKLYGPKKIISRDLLYEGSVIDQLFIFELSQFAPAGEYLLEAQSGSIKEKRNFIVNENKELDMKFGDGKLVIRNIGNVKYNEDVTVTVGNTEEVAILSVNLEPNETSSIDLSKKLKLPKGEDFGLTLETGGVTSSVVSSLNEDEEEAGFFQLTGAAIASLPSNPLVSIIFLIIIVAAVIFHYVRKHQTKKPEYIHEVAKEYADEPKKEDHKEHVHQSQAPQREQKHQESENREEPVKKEIPKKEVEHVDLTQPEHHEPGDVSPKPAQDDTQESVSSDDEISIEPYFDAEEEKNK
tara:strand:- start:7398 stop:9071 length:1674 start_codon:yes stop_codon:yes gene_type:complete